MPTKVYTSEIRLKLTPEQKKRILDQAQVKSIQKNRFISGTEFTRIVVMKYVKEMEDKANANIRTSTKENLEE